MNEIITSIQQLRKECSLMPLLESEASPSPFEQFELWFNQALQAKMEEPYAMVLSTINELKPDSRVVLLREFSREGFGFYTNYNSAKGQQIAINNNVTLNFFWPGMDRQIRIEGIAVKQTDEKSNEYYNTRPEISRVGAWASPQSKTVKNRSELEELFSVYSKKQTETPLLRPPNWGGYLVKPHYFEFWQGRTDHVNDRLAYTLEENNFWWKIQRLAP